MGTDIIKIHKLHIYAYHGVHDWEKEKGQDFYVSAKLYADLYAAGHSDKLSDTVSYSDAAKLIYSTFTEHKHDLIERAAYEAAEALLTEFPTLKRADISVHKPNAPVGLEIDDISVDITLEWHTTYLSIGSNMGDRADNINRAIEMIRADSCMRYVASSSVIETKPYGGVEQGDFLNAALRVDTLYPPEVYLDRLHDIENALGRVRDVHWGPRTIDLDILFYDDLILNTDRLTIPHPDMCNRDFVLRPMCELAPNLIHPIYGCSISAISEKLRSALH